MPDVIVVGAGLAGLAAAQRLRAEGLHPVVLEASSRAGGRVLTAAAGEEQVDLGGQWVGPMQTRIMSLIRDLGLETYPSFTHGRTVLVDADGRLARWGRVPGPAVWATALGSVPALPSLRRLLREVDGAHRGDQGRRADLDRRSVGEWLRLHVRSRRAREWVAVVVRETFCVEPDEVSLLVALEGMGESGGLRSVLGFEGGAQQDLLSEGAGAVVDRLAAGVHLELRSPVRRIVSRGDTVTVSTSRASLSAPHAILAVPPALARQIDVEPGWPPGVQDWLASQRKGRVVKAVAVYRHPFWREHGFSGTVIMSAGPAGMVTDISRPDGPGRLCFIAAGRDADRIAGTSEHEVRARILAALAPVLGPEVERPVAWRQRDWNAEPWIGGGYSAIPELGATARVRADPWLPHHRIHWAGTETASQFAGYMEGAVRSGERAAEEILASREPQSRKMSGNSSESGVPGTAA